MEVVTGAMDSLIPKLWGLVHAEYKLQTGIKAQIESLALDLESAHAALRKVAAVPPDQLDDRVRLWAREIREGSYDMEDVLDTFLARVEGPESSSPEHRRALLIKRLGKKVAKLFKKSKARHDIAGEIDKIKKRLQEVKDRHATFAVDDDIVSKHYADASSSSSSSAPDPRLAALYTQARDLVGIDRSMADVISRLGDGDDGSNNKDTKVVAIVGGGGLGKTTLAKAVYEKLKKSQAFSCGAFVPVGQRPDLKQVLRNILIDLDKKYMDTMYRDLNEKQLIDQIRDFLGTKRYFIVIDDVWEAETWKNIKLALVENNNGSRTIITSRNLEVVTTGEKVYNLQPLSHENSRKLFYTRLFGEDKFPDNQSNEVHKASEEILKKCGGVPLAIITMASFLVGKSTGQWFELCRSASFIHNKDTKWILSLSFNDLPPHLRTCLLYLSAFPEDYFIAKDQLIWKWIAEGFVEEKEGMRLFEVGEGYFNDLVNRSMLVQESEFGCRVHDMVLDLLRHVSREENFFFAISSDDARSSGSKVRRLAIHNRSDQFIVSPRDNIPPVRSFLAFMCDTEKLVSFRGFKLLRVLALEDCHISYKSTVDLEHIGKLIHLRYLGLSGIPPGAVLPEAIGDLKLLQTLNLRGCDQLEFPSSISRLTQLVCLRADHELQLPNGVLVGKLTSLEELEVRPSSERDEDFHSQFVKALGNLTQLRVLRTWITRGNDITESELLQSIGKLQRIQRLSLCFWPDGNARSSTWCTQLLLPCGLSYLDFSALWMKILPPCISRLVNLSHLQLTVLGMDEQGLESLSRLPQLRHLRLATNSTVTLPNVAANGCFQMLRTCSFPWSTVRFVLNGDSSVSFTLWNGEGDMDFVSSRKEEDEERAAPAVLPNLQELRFKVHGTALVSGAGCCDLLGLEYLISLQQIRVHLGVSPLDPYASMEEAEEEEAALRRVVEAHPNHPMFQMLG